MARSLKAQRGGYLRRPLDVVFGVPSHVAVLRALAARESGASGRELARAAGVTNQAALDALGRLETVGIVSRLPMGRGYIFHLNRGHGLVKRGVLTLLQEETEFGVRLRATLKGAFEKDVVSGVIFGSAGRGEERPESDLDLCLVVKREKDKERVEQRAAEMAEAVWKGYGLRLSPLVMTEAEFKGDARRGKELMKNIKADGERFVGRPLEGIGRG